MNTLRSLAFTVWLYMAMAGVAVGLSPALLLPHRYAMGVIRIWARTVLFGLRWIAGVKVEFRGLEHRPAGQALLAGKHQGMLDIVIPFVMLDDPCMVMKQELMSLPFIGWFAAKTKMIAVDRSAGSAALKDMVKQARARIADGRQIMIFPEGTRTAPGAAPDYKPGIAALYRDLDIPCVPVATNSGVHWPAHGFRRYPGTVVYEFLPAIPAGLKRAEFMERLEADIEGRSNALLDPPRRTDLRLGEIKSIGHNLADSLASGVSMLVGFYEIDVFGEASRSEPGYIEVDFLTGKASGVQPSEYLTRAIEACSTDGLDKLCASHGTTRAVFRELTARFGSDAAQGAYFKVTVEDRQGRRSVDTFVGLPGRLLSTRRES